jgi:hypothetical protein
MSSAVIQYLRQWIRRLARFAPAHAALGRPPATRAVDRQAGDTPRCIDGPTGRLDRASGFAARTPRPPPVSPGPIPATISSTQTGPHHERTSWT